MGVHTRFAAVDGAPLEGFLAEPGGGSAAGGLLVLHEWWGLNHQIELTCERLAAEGFVALAPDLYHGKRPETAQHASSLVVALDKARAMREIGAAAAWLRAHPRGNARVGVMGFCLGGAFAFAAARELAGQIVAAVPFYGVPRLAPEQYAQTAAVPIQAHFARHDDWASADAAEQIQRAVRAGGGAMDLFVYDAGHAFMRTTDKHAYDAAAERLAWDRAVAFLKTHVRA